jgi:hypothetical protein
VSHPIDPDKLLGQARALAGVEAGPGRPSTTDHRRAVSAAYYALFHELCLAASRYVLPGEASDREIRQAARWINHKDLRAVCEVLYTCAVQVSPAKEPPKGLRQRAVPLWEALSRPHPDGGRSLAAPRELQIVAVAFVALQAARHSADYDHLADFPKATTIGHVEVASLAIGYLRKHSDDPYFQRLFAWIFANSSGFAV